VDGMMCMCESDAGELVLLDVWRNRA